MAFTFQQGDRPLEGYTIQRGVGRGGFGEVYHALSDGGKEIPKGRSWAARVLGSATPSTASHSNSGYLKRMQAPHLIMI